MEELRSHGIAGFQHDDLPEHPHRRVGEALGQVMIGKHEACWGRLLYGM